ncbi:MAG: glycosyltransferase family 2 protein [Candidatus Dormibacteria bacterium]
MRPRVSVVIPAYNEGSEIVDCCDRILEAVSLPCELLVVYDTPEDTTAPYAQEYSARDARVRPILNTLGRGPAAALRAGIEAARADVVVVTMADGSDDPMQIDTLTRLVERGVVIAAASRYMRGGQQVGGPRLKSLASRLAGLSLNAVARVGTHDPTNSFKAYSTQFLREVGVESSAGFEMGIEMVAKAHRLGLPIAEIPTIWLDRALGESNFQMKRWIPKYLRWYLLALGPRQPRRSGYRVNPHAWHKESDETS